MLVQGVGNVAAVGKEKDVEQIVLVSAIFVTPKNRYGPLSQRTERAKFLGAGRQWA